MTTATRTLGDLLDAIARAQPHADAVVFRGVRISCAELKARADALARALLAAGVRRGDRVAVILPNRPEWVTSLFAASKIGAITVGVSTFSSPRELAWTIEHCRPAAIVATASFRGRDYLGALHEICPELGA